MKKFCCLLLSAALLLALGACGKKTISSTPVYVDEGTAETQSRPRRDTAILYTAGAARRDAEFYAAVQSCYESNTYKYLKGYVGLVDLGGALGVEGGERQIAWLQAMNQMAYEAASPAPVDFAAGVDALTLAVSTAQFPYLCVNLAATGTDTGTACMSAWTLSDYGDLRVAYVGFVWPEDVDASLLAGENVTYELTECAQLLTKTAAAARFAGADYVVALASCGAEAAQTLLAGTQWIDVLLDGAGDGGESRAMTDADGENVLYSGLDPDVDSVGKLVITVDGTLSAEILTDLEDQSRTMLDYLAALGFELDREDETSEETTVE